MTVQHLDFEALYRALIQRDDSYDGRAFVGVTSTGIFCRLSCSARKPKRENCEFYASVSACIDAGFRPCKRCVPMSVAAEADPLVARLVAAMAARPEHRWTEKDVHDLGLNTASVRRSFKRHYGMTFLAFARLSRLQQGFVALADDRTVVDAQWHAGFESGSGFRQAFARLLGVTPQSLQRAGSLRADWIESPLGHMIAVADTQRLHLLEFIDRRALPTELKRLQKNTGEGIGIGRCTPIDRIEAELAAFFEGRAARFDTPLALHGSEFTRVVWSKLRQIPVGETRSYSDIAAEVGRPAAVRAVARANGANQLAIIVPCHRVIGADGSLTGYGGGLWRKQKLIELERKLASV
ncbi:MAG: trifunctional transcriptional activator/DNA repair protein Ada/methylated-DNA--[protein]-cysteine S-methyltransferase [Pseudomonadota bacterium]